MVISAFRKGLFPKWLVLKTNNKDRYMLLKVGFFFLGDIFSLMALGDFFSLSRSCSMLRGQVMPACSWLPAEQSKKPVRRSVHSARARAMLPHLSPAALPAGSSSSPSPHTGMVVNVACSPAPLCWHAYSTGLGNSFRSLLRSQNKLSSQKNIIC